MLGFVLKRVAATIPVLLIVALIVFMILRLSPGDPAAIIAGDTATPEDIAKIRQHLGQQRAKGRQDAGIRGREGADGQLARLPSRGLARQHARMLHAAEDVARLLQEDAACIGHRHAMVVALQQLHAEVGLQAADLLAQRGLRRVQPLGGTGETELLGDGHVVAQVSKLQCHCR